MKRYVLVGASYRALFMYARPLLEKYSEQAEIVGVFDSNPLRAEALRTSLGLACPSYADFDRMLDEQSPDRAFITTVDSTHHEYIVKCLDAGVEPITEKPMTTDEEKCLAITEAERRTGLEVIVTFNYRFAPYATAIKQVMEDGVIGKVLSVDFEYLLDTVHGASYFRRWNRLKRNSGGLLVHKATHHFDLINWWIEEEPVEVMAYGSRRFYTPDRKEKGERCLICNYKKSCEYYYDMNCDEVLRTLFGECESADGYYRDRCIFAEEIDIEDTMSVNVRYSTGALLTYSLIAHSPYEGYKASINGTKGRLEIAEYHSGLRKDDPVQEFDLYDRNGRKITYTVPKADGGHGGGDEKLLEMIVVGNVPDPLGHMASSYEGAASILIGIAANKSIAEGRNVRIGELVNLDEWRQDRLIDLCLVRDRSTPECIGPTGR